MNPQKEMEFKKRIAEIQSLQLALQNDLIPYIRDNRPSNLFQANFSAQFMNKSIESAMDCFR